MSDALRLALRTALRAERSRQGLSQADLGVRLGVSQSTVADMEVGARRIHADELAAICRALGIPLARLLVDADPDDLRALGLPST